MMNRFSYFGHQFAQDDERGILYHINPVLESWSEVDPSILDDIGSFGYRGLDYYIVGANIRTSYPYYPDLDDEEVCECGNWDCDYDCANCAYNPDLEDEDEFEISDDDVAIEWDDQDWSEL